MLVSRRNLCHRQHDVGNGADLSMTLALILASLAAVSLLLFVWPYLLYPRVLAMLQTKPVTHQAVDLSLSLLFCVYNESRSLPSKLENLRKLKTRHPDLEILAFDDGSDDGSGQMLAAEANLLTLIKGAGRSGKAAGMKRLAARARGEILVFTDANVMLADDALDRLKPYYADEEIGGVCGTLRYGEADSMTAEVGAEYWSLDEKLRSLESATGNVIGADGSIFSIRKALYPEFPDTVLDDFTVSMHTIFSGKRLAKAPDVIAFENSVTLRREEFRRKIRIGARSWHTHSFLRPKLRKMAPLDRFKYVSRKMLRWFGGVFLVLAGLFGLAAIAALSIPVAIAAMVALALAVISVLRSRSGKLARIGEILVAVFGTQIGILKAMRGETIVTWAPAESR